MTARALRSVPAPAATAEQPPTVQLLSLALLDEPTFNRPISPGTLDELTGSIRQYGVRQPIEVRPKGPRFEIVAGVRRTRASALAGLDTIPAFVKDLTDAETLVLRLVENLQRESLHPLDEAIGYQQLLDADPTHTVSSIAVQLSKPAPEIGRKLRYLTLIPAVQHTFRDGTLPEAYAQLLTRVPAERQPEAFDHCFYGLFSGDDGKTRENLAPLKQLRDWLRTKVALDLCHEETRELLPQLAEQMAEREAAGATVLAVSTLHQHTDKSGPKPILVTSWKRVGKKRCPHAQPAVIVIGEGQGESLSVCVAKKQCRVHWPKPTPAVNAADTAKARAAAAAEETRRAKAQQERELWDQHLQPALLAAIAEKAARLSLSDRLIRSVLDELVNDAQRLTKLCGLVGKLTPKRYAQVLVVALALRVAYHQDSLIAQARRLGIDAKAIRQDLVRKLAKPRPTRE